MPFGRWLVVAPALRKGEAVVDAWIDFQLSAIAGLIEQRLQFRNHRQRCKFVMFGAGDIEFTFGFSQGQMRAFLIFADQPRAIE
jgi:hypothetical protein